MAPTPSLKVTKSFGYKGTTKLFSNRYHFNGGTPADDSHWHALMDAVVAAEKHIYDSTVTIVEAVGYAAGSDLPVSSKSYTTAGDATLTFGTRVPGEVAALLRYSTTARSVKNHPIYLFNYFHGFDSDTSTSNENILPGQKTLLEAYADAWMAGFSDGSITAVRAGPKGATATSRLVHAYLTHRDFPD